MMFGPFPLQSWSPREIALYPPRGVAARRAADAADDAAAADDDGNVCFARAAPTRVPTRLPKRAAVC